MRFANRDERFDPHNDEHLHRDLFVDLLHCLITRDGGTYVMIAARAGYSYRYLKYLRDNQRSVPPPEAVERIVRALPDASEGEARALREFARRAASYREPAYGSVRLALEPNQVAADLNRLVAGYQRVMSTGAVGPDRRGFPDLLGCANRLLGRIRRLEVDPFTSARLFIVRANLLIVLDDPGAALKAVRIARRVLDLRVPPPWEDEPQRTALLVEAHLTEASVFQAMDHDRLALVGYDRAEHLLIARPDAAVRAHVALGRASALAGTRRFRIGEVKDLIEVVHRACDGVLYSDAAGDLLRLRAQGELANAYVRHGDLKPRTGRLVHDALERADRVELAGPIHRVRLYRIAAAYYAARGDPAGRHEYLTRALAIARTGGLAHLVRTIEKDGRLGVALAAN